MMLREVVCASELWEKLVADSDTAIYHDVMRSACQRGAPFALGGSQAMSLYVGRLRVSKDLDIYVKPDDRDHFIGMLTELGFEDYHEQKPYDRRWIYRGIRGDSIVDVIWSMANRRTEVDDDWLMRGMEVDIEGCRVRLIPLEEMLWSKLYVLQRDRCDWPDILNLLDNTHQQLDWRRLLNRLGPDKALLAGLLHIYAWLRPDQARKTPAWVWLELTPEFAADAPREQMLHRVELLDSRPWFLSAMNNEERYGG